MLRFRLAALLGKHLGEIDGMPSREFDQWAIYWNAEPWGAYRDNLHAAMLAVQILRPHLKDPKKLPPFSEFMFKPAEREDESAKAKNALSFFHLLKSQAKKKKRP